MALGVGLSHRDRARVCAALETLAAHGFREFALTGSVALRIHGVGPGDGGQPPSLNDLDLVVEGFGSIPESLAAAAFLFRHIHPHAPPGRILVQLVEPETALRIDVFRARDNTMARCELVTVGPLVIRVVSVEDLTARSAALVLGLDRGHAVARKHARDLESLLDRVDPDGVEIAWRDHRKAGDPSTFREARARIADLVRVHADLLVVPEYSQDVDAVCSQCEETGAFRPAPATQVQALLGYC